MNSKGTLPKGLEINGSIFRQFTMREQVIGDEVEVMESPNAARAMKNDSFFGICIMARRLRFDGYEGEITPSMVMGMAASDYQFLMSQNHVQETERSSFRGAAEAAPDDAIVAP